ncbi:MAG: hypothetical protein KJZ86_13095 [Caldilineaceae bacterium]|nr:hypothetical protein [Caldilineaceae bacterium]HRJ41414.1 hypothetical protein [Caldilineaceae bacterium]
MESTVLLPIPEDQIIALAQQLTPRSKRALLQRMIPEMEALDRLVGYGEQRIRAIGASMGTEWELLSEDERMQLVDQLIHENSHS